MTDQDPRPTIALVPLDERPACAHLPVAVARIAGVRAVLPPPRLLPSGRVPGDPDALGRWLSGTARSAVAAVVSLETLGYGGLIASRTRDATIAEVTRRWTALRDLARPGTPVHAVTLITRTPDSPDAGEEPSYWDPHGPALHQYSAHLHRHGGAAVPPPPELPAEVRADFLRRRLRNHALNIAALELVADATLTSLVIGADDTAPFALATAELGWLGTWNDWLGTQRRVTVRPGADEACSTLVARCLVDHFGGPPPTVTVEAVDPRGLARIAPYENVTVAETARGQIHACGARPADPSDRADVHLLVHTPDGSGDWAVDPPDRSGADRAARHGADRLAGRAADLIAAGRSVAVADCAQPNGADPLLVDALVRHGVLEHLSGYAGWNTAGNTLGSTLAQAVAVHTARRAGTFDRTAHHTLLLHRLLEDWAYMTHVRTELRRRLGSDPTRHDHVPDGHPLLADAEQLLRDHRDLLPAFGGLTVTPGTLRLPWQRTFEADFALSPRRPTHPAEDHR
ncbi:DUF4127 family protein [Streptomyces sp. NPDC002057]|uniref:DUF4127 family protein n=1 Tax=Streptomyces sp. NPDC002057 TaxID=3154664 RepID=UPI003326AA33